MLRVVGNLELVILVLMFFRNQECLRFGGNFHRLLNRR